MPVSRYAILMLLCGTVVAIVLLAWATDQRLVLGRRGVSETHAPFAMILAVLAWFFWARISSWGLVLSALLSLSLILGSVFDWIGWNARRPSTCQVILILASVATTFYGWHQSDYLREPHDVR